MLVDPVVVSRPGDSQSNPAGVCELNGVSSPADGPYAVNGGKFYSIRGVRELAKALGLTLTDTAQAKLEELLRDNATLRARVESAAEQYAAADGERHRLFAELDAATQKVATLAAELARTRTLAEIAAEYLAPPKQNGRTKVTA